MQGSAPCVTHRIAAGCSHCFRRGAETLAHHGQAELVRLPKPWAGAKPTFVRLHPAVMGLCMSGWWGLCAERQMHLIKLDDKKLGEWVGLCKIDREGKPCKVLGCSCVVVKVYGKESRAKDVIEEHFKK